MNAKMMTTKIRIGALALATCGLALGGTVALWPLEYTSGAFDGRCAVNAAYDLQIATARNVITTEDALPWNLPPQPDRARHAWTPVTRSAVRMTPATTSGGLYNDAVGARLARTGDFTVEGWLKLNDLPASNKWSIVATAFNNEYSDSHRWALSFRRRSNENYACSWILWAQGGNDTVLFADADEAASYARTNVWTHVALVHRAPQNGKDTFTLYLDGVQAGVATFSFTTTQAPTSSLFELAARMNMGGNDGPLPATLDYWRISDAALAPEGFLCAGDAAGTVVAPAASSTVAYWPLGVTAKGGVDGRDAVGDAPLTAGQPGTSAFRAVRLGAREDGAFAGQPPNTTVTLDNAGGVEGAFTAGCLQEKGSAVGAVLSLTNDFTVEAWFAPRVSGCTNKNSSAEVATVLFGTRPAYAAGWNLQYRARGADNCQIDLYCIDPAYSVVQNCTVLAGDLSSWYETWRHVALVYTKEGGDAGFGRWTLYLDGVEAGHADNTRAVGNLGARPFILGGRASVANQSFPGAFDCARVTQAALTPSQFLNAANGTSATDVVALWPLDVMDGCTLDLRDVSGKGNDFATQLSDSQRVAGCADLAPAIANPDATPDFRGDPAHVTGCAAFRDVTTGARKQSCLVTASTKLCNVVSGGKDFTVECYYRRAAATTTDQEVFFYLGKEDPTQAAVRLFRKPDGIYVWEGLNGGLSDTRIPGTADADLLADTWYHLAFVHAIETGDDGARTSVWRVYVDGALKGTASCSYNGSTSVGAYLSFGGRWWHNGNSVNGYLSSLRLSNCALTPTDFLCATPASAAATDSVDAAYWPLDAATGAGLANLVDAAYPLRAAGTVAVCDDGARASIPNPAALAGRVTGTARRNAGAYALGAAGALAADTLGFTCDPRQAFTVEGWVKWDASVEAQEQVIWSVGDGEGGQTLRFVVDRSGATPRLAVRGRGSWPATPFVEAAFDLDFSSSADVWTHLALVYTPFDGAGTWTLYVDGRAPCAPVRNFYRPTSADRSRTGLFRVGATDAVPVGAVDMWRLVEGALSPAEFLYANPFGSVFFLR